jgi:hypothetical protein
MLRCGLLHRGYYGLFTFKIALPGSVGSVSQNGKGDRFR